MLILSGSSHPKLAAALAKSLSAPLVRRTISRFSDQTFKIRINSNVKDKTVIIVQTLIHPVHDHLIELLLLADAAKFLKSLDAKSVSVFATHGILANGFQKLRSAGINSITLSDSVPHKNLPAWIKTASIIPTLSAAGKTISKHKTPPNKPE